IGRRRWHDARRGSGSPRQRLADQGERDQQEREHQHDADQDLSHAHHCEALLLLSPAEGGTGLRSARMSCSTAGMAASGSNERSTARRQNIPSQTMMKALVTVGMSSAGAIRPSACILRNSFSKLSAM